MPFDGDASKVAKPDVFSLEGLIAWLEEQPGDMPYRYSDPRHCLMGKYVEACSGKYDAGSGHYIVEQRRLDAEPMGMGVFDLVACLEPKTFGGALSRARALLSSSIERRPREGA